MEASGTSTPAQPPPPPTGTAVSGGGDDKAGWGWRIAALVLGLVLAFGVAVMVIVPLNPDDTPRCEQIQSGEVTDAFECFDTTKNQQLAQNVVAIIAAALGTVAILLCLYFLFTGRRGSTLLKATAAAVAAGVIVFLIGQL